MQAIFSAIYYFFRMGPLGLLVIAILVAAAGYFLQIADNDSRADKARALAEGPPPIVNIEDYDRSLHRNDAREVRVRAQLDMTMKYRLTQEDRTRDKLGYMIPLIAVEDDRAMFDGEQVGLRAQLNADALEGPAPVHGIMLHAPRDLDFDTMDTEFLFDQIEGFGEFGPIVVLNGFAGGKGALDDVVDGAFEDRNRTLPGKALILKPFAEGREAALVAKPKSEVAFFALAIKAAGAIALFALFKFAILGGGTRPKKVKEPLETDALPSVVPQFMPIDPDARAAELAQQDSRALSRMTDEDLPDWKRRLEQKMQQPAPVVAAEQPEPVVRTPRAPTTMARKLRKLAFAGILGIFVLVLGSTVYTLVAGATSSTETVQVLSAEERLAAAAVKALIPETADADKAMWDIDVAPIAQWSLAKAMLAASGDADAVALMAWMIGGSIFVMIMLRMMIMVWFIRPRQRTHNFSDLMTS